MTQPMAALEMMRALRRDRGDQRKLPPGTWKRILAFAQPYRRDIVVFLAATVVSSVIAVITPLLAGRVVDAISRGGPRSTVVTVALVIAGLAVFDTVLSMVGRWFSSRIGEGIILSLRSSVFSHVQRMPVAFFSRTQTGALVSRLNNDVIGAQRAFTSTLSGVVSNVIALVLTLAVMLTLSWQITLAALVLLPVFVLPARRVGRRLASITREAAELNASMNTTMTERFNVAGAMLVKLFGRPEDEEEAFSRRAARVRDVGVLSAVYSRAFFAALTLVAALATALVYGAGGWLALAGNLSAGTVVSLALLLTRLYGPLTALSNVQLDVASALVSFDRVFEVLDLEPALTPGPETIPANARSVEFRSVSFSYPAAEEVSLASLEDVAVLDSAPRTQVLHDIDFEARPGQLVALVGPSGAGKTTISSLVPRLYDVDSGAVLVGGVDVREATTASLRDTVGVVTQEAHLFHDTIRANLLFARPDATEERLWDALDRARIATLVRSLPDGLDTVVGERGHRLSGGEKQRLAIARLLLKAPGVVILDEATAHLDADSERAVQQALDEALTDRTALVIAHRLSTVRDADLILVVDQGRIVERGTHDSLIAAGGLYASLYETFSGAPSERLRSV
ncbi:ABC transporter ATP-binding protein [Cryptosporangium sp. NPDC048952]|uniref:ABC transporter ATP-binding protein n=1 Tax=Cryptosporangium sp. NPDC048952 TaxID=3363961 RepID=UPI003719F17D